MCLNGTFLNKKIIKGFAPAQALIFFLNKFSVNFERSDQRGRPHGLKIIKKLNKKIIKGFAPA